MKGVILLLILLPLFQLVDGQPPERVYFRSISTSEETGQDYTPWLNDDLEQLVKNTWSSNNLKYVTVTLQLAKHARLSKISLYDNEGVFQDFPVYVYAISGTKKTLLG